MFDLFKKKSPEAEPVAQRTWAERLKAGLGLSRDKLAGALTGVFARRASPSDVRSVKEIRR